jgi:hypothetical protein
MAAVAPAWLGRVRTGPLCPNGGPAVRAGRSYRRPRQAAIVIVRGSAPSQILRPPRVRGDAPSREATAWEAVGHDPLRARHAESTPHPATRCRAPQGAQPTARRSDNRCEGLGGDGHARLVGWERTDPLFVVWTLPRAGRSYPSPAHQRMRSASRVVGMAKWSWRCHAGRHGDRSRLLTHQASGPRGAKRPAGRPGPA